VNRPKTTRKALLISSIAFVLQGSWAVYANQRFGLEKSLVAGLVQGLCSFAMTFVTTMILEYLLALWRALAPGIRLVAVVTVTTLIIALVQSTAHWIAGTPEIAITIAPAVILGGVYCVVYAFGKMRFSPQC